MTERIKIYLFVLVLFFLIALAIQWHESLRGVSAEREKTGVGSDGANATTPTAPRARNPVRLHQNISYVPDEPGWAESEVEDCGGCVFCAGAFVQGERAFFLLWRALRVLFVAYFISISFSH